jgi:pimeloyl-ACP methyl ester carboxylesterase
MLAIGGAGHSWAAWEDFAARVWERVLPCSRNPRADSRLSLAAPLRAGERRPDVAAQLCAENGDDWVVFGVAAPKMVSLATADGCEQVAAAAVQILRRLNSTRGTVHLSGASAGGIATLECVARHPAVFASATAFAGFVESVEQEEDEAEAARLRAAAGRALQGKPVRVYVGADDELFHEIAVEQFGADGTVRAALGRLSVLSVFL